MPWRLPHLNTDPKTVPPSPQERPSEGAAPAKESRWRRLLPQSAGGHDYETGVRQMEAGNWEAAIAAFERIVARSKRGRGVTGELARFYLCEAHLHFAVSLVEANPDSKPARDKAITHLTRALSLGPQHADVLYHLGRLYLKSSRDGEARDVLDRAITVNPSYARAHLLLGIIQYRNGEHEGGLILSEVAASMDGTLDTAFLVDAHYATAQKRFDDAQSLLCQMSETVVAEPEPN